MRTAVRIMAGVTVLGCVLAGCGEDDERGGADPGRSASPSATATEAGSDEDENEDGGGGTDGSGSPGQGRWGTGGTPAAAGAAVGGPGSPCELPLSFRAAKAWRAKAVDAEVTRGGLTVACEVDAKPAGNIGFLRVWTGEAGSPRAALDAFVREHHPKDVRHRTTRAGSAEVAEASYVSRVVVDGEEFDRKPVLAFAVPTGDGAVGVVELGGMDAEEHKEMLPAYHLAKKTLRVSNG